MPERNESIASSYVYSGVAPTPHTSQCTIFGCSWIVSVYSRLEIPETTIITTSSNNWLTTLTPQGVAARICQVYPKKMSNMLKYLIACIIAHKLVKRPPQEQSARQRFYQFQYDIEYDDVGQHLLIGIRRMLSSRLSSNLKNSMK